MKPSQGRWVSPSLAAIGLCLLQTGGFGQSPRPRRDYPVQPVPFTAVRLDDAFWAPRIETNRTATIPVAFEQCERTNRVDLFVRAGQVLKGQEPSSRNPPGYPFDDSDVYKVIEGASYTLSVRPDPKLDAYVDSLIEKIAAAQEPDGYLYTTRTINPQQPHRWAGPERWVLERDDSHELYNLGHLFEAATAHFLATGKKTLLDVAIKAADLLVATFGPGKRSTWPGHQITEMGLVKMYRVTGTEAYLSLARFLLDERGPGPFPPGERANPRGLEYNQAHQKVIEQTEPVGHAVRATYMYSGMADVAAMTGDETYVKAIDTIWENTVTKKLYITGGIGASGAGEAFGRHYQLPNMTAYNETCASVGMDYWNHRLFLLHGDAKYVDVMERTLFNGLISGVSLDGKTFFYPNPLESKGQHQRSPWFGVACCPSNISRFLPSIPGYVYARQKDTIYVNLFIQGTGEITLDGGRKVKLAQQTRYPWDGAVKLTVTPARTGTFAINVRIPGWARNEPVPGDLYRFLNPARQGEPDDPEPVLAVNGKPVPMTLNKGYVRLTRTWRAGDVIDLTLPMPIRRIVANEKVQDDAGRVALQRGPIVYAAEWPDNPNGRVRNLVLPDSNRLTAEFRPDLLDGVTVIKGRAVGLAYDESGTIKKTGQDFVAIPYATWANRGSGEMMVWLPRAEAHGRPTPYPTIATAATIMVSVPGQGRGKNPRPINDGEDPQSSDDASSYFDWWPTLGSSMEWVEMTFAKPATVSASSIYWFDDTGRGAVRVPASWRLLYREGTEWKPVEAAGRYGVERDTFNTVAFRAVTTSGLRIELAMRCDRGAAPDEQARCWSAGLQEWKVK
jgi:uncharacterized protein